MAVIDAGNTLERRTAIRGSRRPDTKAINDILRLRRYGGHGWWDHRELVGAERQGLLANTAPGGPKRGRKKRVSTFQGFLCRCLSH